MDIFIMNILYIASTVVAPARSTTAVAMRPISLLRFSQLRFIDSNFPGNTLWEREFHLLKLRFCLNNPLKSRILVQRLAVVVMATTTTTPTAANHHGHDNCFDSSRCQHECDCCQRYGVIPRTIAYDSCCISFTCVIFIHTYQLVLLLLIIMIYVVNASQSMPVISNYRINRINSNDFSSMLVLLLLINPIITVIVNCSSIIMVIEVTVSYYSITILLLSLLLLLYSLLVMLLLVLLLL